MLADFVTLTCPTCGGKLQITPDLDHFACGHCGNEHVVRRAGGVVSLRPVEGLLEKTASELAIRRLQGEVDSLAGEVARLTAEVDQLSVIGPPSTGLTVFVSAWVLLTLLAWMPVLGRLGSGGAASGDSADTLFILAVYCLCPGAFGVIPLYWLYRVHKDRRKHVAAQAALEKLRPPLKLKVAELEKRKRQLEKHRAVVDG